MCRRIDTIFDDVIEYLTSCTTLLTLIRSPLEMYHLIDWRNSRVEQQHTTGTRGSSEPEVGSVHLLDMI